MEIILYVIRILGLFVAVSVCYWIIRNRLSVAESLEDNLDHGIVDPALIEASVKAFGRNTSSVVHMYGQLSHMSPFDVDLGKDKRSLVAYISNPRNNIMVMDPLCERGDARDAIVEFTKFTQARGKTSLLFPVDLITARQAAEIGYGILQVGKEPVFDLTKYSPEGVDKKIQSAVRQVHNKGITVEAVSYQEIEIAGWKSELDEVLNEWLMSRHSQKMEILLEVSPFKYHEEKKYFVARSKDRIEAFLSCSPIFGRKGFFIHDLIRRPTAMNGVAEALNLAALTKLKAEGYTFASLGTAPLAGLDSVGANSNYRLLNKILVHVFNSHKMFMRFKSLYSFKKKFKPTDEEPTFLAFYPPSLRIRDAFAVMSLFSGQGPIGDIIFKMKRWLAGEQLPKPLIHILSPDVATLARPIPFTFYEFVSRLRFTFLIFALNVYTYATTNDYYGKLEESTIAKYGFTFQDFFAHKWFILFTSNFLHFSYGHLFGNMVMLFLFGGTLEFIAGSWIVVLAYIIAMNSNVPVALVLLPVLKRVNLEVWQHIVSYTDVGASLGVMGCLGALLQFVRNKRQILLLGCLITIAVTVFKKELFGIDHTFAVVIGYLTGHVYLYQRFHFGEFQRFFPSPDRLSRSNSPIPFRSAR